MEEPDLSVVDNQIRVFEDFFELYKAQIIENARKGILSFTFPFYELARFNYPLSDLLLDKPEDTIKAAEMAIENFDLDGKKLKIRVVNIPNDRITLIREIRGKAHYSKFIQIEGMIKSKSKVRNKIIIAKFECPACQNIFSIMCLQDVVRQPVICPNCRRKGKFKFLQDDCVKTSTFVLTLQEAPDKVKVGSDLQTLSCIFYDDLCVFEKEQRLYQGCRVNLNGILKEVYLYDRFGNMRAVSDHYLEVNSVEKIQGDFGDIEITKEDEENINTLAKREDVLDLLSTTIFSPIHGQDAVKQAVTLMMWKATTFTKRNLKSRGIIHILLIGDPGTSKSDCLLLAKKYHPKAMYLNLSGESATEAGLKASVTKDPLTNEPTFTAGAIPMMHKGILMLDEINALEEKATVLQEPMEQMCCTVQKWNISATLLAETSILGACNPKTGRFDPFSNIYEQISMPPQLVNRFDLIFPYKDIMDVTKDGKIADAILDRHNEKATFQMFNIKKSCWETHIVTEFDALNKNKDYLNEELIKKWIIISQKYEPTLPTNVRDYMKERYVSIRNKKTMTQSDVDAQYKAVPISPRQLQAMIRLSQAYAKIKLQQEVNLDMAEYSVNLVEGSLQMIGIDPETGEIDIQKIEGSLVASKRKKMSIVKQIIYDAADTLPFEELKTKAEEKGITEFELDELLSILSRDGDAFEPRRGFWKRI